jgi:hypothetical protein
MTRPAFEPYTIACKCHRCLCTIQSKPRPAPGAMGTTGLPLLRLYGLPDGWELITTPRGQDDVLRCAECVADVARGSPIELGLPGR